MDLASSCNNRESDQAEWILDVFFCNMRSSEIQRKWLSATIRHSEALSQALIDEMGYFTHQKLTNMTKLKTVKLQIIQCN